MDWYVSGDSLPDTAPVLFLAPTLMGDGRTEATRGFADLFASRGWRCVCFVKRGGGYFDMLPLTDWTPPDPTGLDEIALGLRLVRGRHPGCFLAVAGLSAGGTWVRRYCAAAGAASLADAAFCLDGPWEWGLGIPCADSAATVVCKALGTCVARPLLTRAAAGHTPPAWLNLERLAAARSESWMAVMEAAHLPWSGLPTLQHYFREHCDRGVELPKCSAVPLLIMGSEGDGCCPGHFWTTLDRLEEIPSQCPNSVVCVSSVGAHVCRPSGLLGLHSWAADVALEFLSAARAEHEGGLAACG